jgi:hypothetical protein
LFPSTEVDKITAITNQPTGRKLQIIYGNVTASINPAQITEVLPPEIIPKEKERMSLSTSQILREMAEDYLHLAADTDGKVDGLRTRNYRWLVRLSERLKVEEKRPK